MTIVNVEYEHEVNDTLYVYAVVAECYRECVEGTYRKDAPSDWDYYGTDEVYIKDFLVTDVERYVDGVMVDFCDDQFVIGKQLTPKIEQGILCAIEDEVRGG